MAGYKVKVVIPAFNEAATIAGIITPLKALVDSIVVIDDCSSDNTSEIARSCGATVFKNPANLGYSKSIQAGLKAALAAKDSELIVTMDADGQHTLKAVREVIRCAEASGVDFVIGHRGQFARMSEYLFSYVFRLWGGVSDPLSGLKVYRTATLQSVMLDEPCDSVGTNAVIRMVSKGASYREVPIDVIDRVDESRLGGRFASNVKIIQSLVRVIPLLASNRAQGVK